MYMIQSEGISLGQLLLLHSYLLIFHIRAETNTDASQELKPNEHIQSEKLQKEKMHCS